MDLLQTYLEQAVADGASDLFIVTGSPVSEKREGRLVPVKPGDGKLSPKDTEALVREIYTMIGRDIQKHFLEQGDDDFALSTPYARFRVNVYRQRGSMAAVLRVVAYGIPDAEEKSIPEEVLRLAEESHGLILFTGTAGSGKSTTQACLIDRINHNPEKNYHIITLEDPVEYLHRNDHSIISQREIGLDAQDYPTALRACLRQAPDVILLGEMRDPETIRTVMTAAETGHLVIATLHTSGAVNAVDRIVDTFPGDQQGQIRVQLSSVLRAVISQQLLPDVNGGQVPAFEIMTASTAVKNIIRDAGKMPQLNNAIASGAADGMIAMDQYVQKLYREGRISRETAEGAVEKEGAKQMQAALDMIDRMRR